MSFVLLQRLGVKQKYPLVKVEQILPFNVRVHPCGVNVKVTLNGNIQIKYKCLKIIPMYRTGAHSRTYPGPSVSKKTLVLKYLVTRGHGIPWRLLVLVLLVLQQCPECHTAAHIPEEQQSRAQTSHCNMYIRQKIILGCGNK